MAMIGEQFLVGDEICGIVLSLRNPWDQVNRNSSLDSDHNCDFSSQFGIAPRSINLS